MFEVVSIFLLLFGSLSFFIVGKAKYMLADTSLDDVVKVDESAAANEKYVGRV